MIPKIQTHNQKKSQKQNNNKKKNHKQKQARQLTLNMIQIIRSNNLGMTNN